MKQIYDYHVHTAYCDGKDTPREMAHEAVARGFEILGFSGHGYTDFDESFCMSRIRTDSYLDEVHALKAELSGSLTVLCGIEQDYFSSHPTTRFDYVIGSVHYLYVNGAYVPLDMEVKTMRSLIDEVYGGDFSALACDYFAQVGDVLNRTEGDIIGHFDLITKFQNRTELVKDARYYDAAFAAIDALIPYRKPFEINLGAIARGYRRSPYPDGVILREIKRRGGDIIITGDCHDKGYLGANYDTAAALARDCGFDRRVILTERGAEYRPL